MKRRGGNIPRKKGAAETTAKPEAKKNANGGAVNTAEESAVEERKLAEESIQAAELATLWSGVEQEMTWATSWKPFWEVEAAYDALYGDVLWDYDIWDLQSIRNAPNP